MGGVGRRFVGYFDRPTRACSLGCVMDDPDLSMSRARSRESWACPIMSSRWIPGGITPALTERRERFEFVSGVDGKIGDSRPSAERTNPDARCRFGSTLCYPTDCSIAKKPKPFSKLLHHEFYDGTTNYELDDCKHKDEPPKIDQRCENRISIRKNYPIKRRP